MEEKRSLSLSLGSVSWEKELGDYYIDMRAAKTHYTDGTYRTKFDERGVPMIPTQDGYKYFPINISQYGFILLSEYNSNKSDSILTTLKELVNVLESLKSEDKYQAIWWHDFKNLRYNIPAPWASAMAQGEIISFYLRMYQITNDKNLLITSEKAANFLLDETHNKRVAIRDENGYLWLEEYPSTPPSYVLNGFVYALFGLVDLYRVKRGSKIKKAIDECFLTLSKNIHRFDAGYWSYYDLLIKELVRYYYQKNVHVLELEVLYILTNDEVFNKYAKKWKKQINPVNFAFVRIMYRVLPRIRKTLR